MLTNWKRRHLILWVLLFGTSIPARGDEIDEYLKRVMEPQHIPAISIAVIKDGVVIKSQGYGRANLEHNIPAQPDTVYKIGSTSKQFIATGIMLLVQDGKLAVDDKVRKYLPDTPDSWEAITVRHLLTHTSGLAREGPAFDPYKIQPDIDVIRSGYPLPLLFAPGEKWEYSNLGYYTLAEIIHRVSGKPWADFLTDRVFTPLGMAATQATAVAKIIPNRADGYVEWRQTRERAGLACGAAERRVPVHSSGYGEVGGGFAHGSDLDGVKQDGHVDTCHIKQRPKIRLWIRLGTRRLARGLARSNRRSDDPSRRLNPRLSGELQPLAHPQSRRGCIDESTRNGDRSYQRQHCYPRRAPTPSDTEIGNKWMRAERLIPSPPGEHLKLGNALPFHIFGFFALTTFGGIE
jgi:CubicO group peptidase (beta-lactamase class C family)